MNNYIQGNDVLLYINGVAVACLTDNPLQESTEIIETTAKGNGGFRSYIAGIQDYSISFTGHMVTDAGVISYADLKNLKRNREVFDWRITDGDTIDDIGAAFISSLSLISTVGEIVSFSATLTPSVGGIATPQVWSQDGFNIVTQDGNNLIQV